MTGDFSRSTFDPPKHYRGVRLQQGRVNMDADWNEAFALQAELATNAIGDIVGANGAPAQVGQPGAFQLFADGNDLRITPGRLYVHGAPCELDPPTSVRCQPVSGQPTQLSVHTWVVDGWPFAPGQLVNVIDDTNTVNKRSIHAADPDTRTLILSGGDVPSNAQRISRVCTYCFQPFVPTASVVLNSSNPPAYVAYIDVWQRDVTALEDPSIADVALDGADSAVREQTVWQVKLWPLQQAPSSHQQALQDWQAALASRSASHAQMSAVLEATSATLVENQFYRVQIHSGSIPPSMQVPTTVSASLGDSSNQVKVDDWSPDGVAWELGQTLLLTSHGRPSSTVLGQVVGTTEAESTLTLDVTLSSGWTGTARRVVTFKWARDNASSAVAITGILSSSNSITIDVGNPRATAFSQPGWIELSSASRGLLGLPGVMLYVTKVEGAVLTVNYLPDQVNETWTVRRWDGPYRTLNGLASPNHDTLNEADNVPLENGIAVAFSGGISFSGDYWNIAARANTQSIEWPSDGGPVSAPPVGITHQFAPVAIVKWDSAGSKWTADDVRGTFAGLINFVDRRGDIMTGPLITDRRATTTVLRDPSTPYDLITSGPIYVGQPSASQTSVPDFSSVDIQAPDNVALGVNGGVMVWGGEDQGNSWIYLQPGTEGNNVAPARIVLQSTFAEVPNSPRLEFHNDLNVTDPNKALIALHWGQDPTAKTLFISSPANPPTNPSGQKQPFTVRIAGNLVVEGTTTQASASVVGALPSARNSTVLAGETAAAVVNQARTMLYTDTAQPTPVRNGFHVTQPSDLISTHAGSDDDLHATVAALTAVVQRQAAELTRLSALVAQLASPIQEREVHDQ